MSDFTPTPRTTMRRLAKRGAYGRDTVYGHGGPGVCDAILATFFETLTFGRPPHGVCDQGGTIPFMRA